MDDSTFVIIGSNGQLGTALRQKYPNARAVGSVELNITDASAVKAFDWSNVTVIFNAAAYTNVDGAETAEGRLAAWNVNAVGARNLAAIAAAHDILIVHISSEYVFDGNQTSHTEDEPFSPLGVYAATKAAGDIAVSLAPKHYLLRTSWVIGEGKNFVRTVFGLGQKGIAPTVVGDQIGRLTFTKELVRAIDHVLQTAPAYGTYNVSNGGDPVSWADVSRAIFEYANYELTITNTTTAEYFAAKPEAAPRPLHSTLELSKLQKTGFASQDWRQDLKDYIIKETTR